MTLGISLIVAGVAIVGIAFVLGITKRLNAPKGQ